MRGVAISYSGASLGAIIAPLIVTPLAVTRGWRSAFWVTGLMGLFWLGLWSVISRRPDLARPQRARIEESESKLRWNDRRVWAFTILMGLSASPLGFVLYQSSLYLSSVLHRSQAVIGYVLWMPPLTWEVGFFVWGWVIDRLMQRSTWRARLRSVLLAQVLLMLPLAAIPYVRSFPLTMVIFCVTMFVVAGVIIGVIAYGTKLYSASNSGMIAGLTSGAYSGVVALLLPVVGRLFDLRLYGWAFALATLLPIIGYAIWRVLDAEPAAAAS